MPMAVICINILIDYLLSREEGKDQESMQSSTISMYLAWNTILESDKNTRKHNTQESQEVSPFTAVDLNAARNRKDSITKTNIDDNKNPQKSTTRHRSAVGNKSDCRSRDRESDHGPVPYFRGD